MRKYLFPIGTLAKNFLTIRTNQCKVNAVNLGTDYKKLLKTAESWRTRILSDLIALSEIPAPSFKEGKRRKKFTQLMERINFDKLEQDGVGNIIGIRKGKGKGGILVSAHLDTVFPETLNHTTRINMKKVYGPSVGDNSLGLASILATGEILNELKITTHHDLLFAGTVGGETNLQGMRKLIEEHGKELKYVICVEGHGLGRIDNVAIGNMRMELNIRVKEGHSFRDFGSPNAIVLMSKLINRFLSIPKVSVHKVALNISHIYGGIAYDSIPISCKTGIELSYRNKKAFTDFYKKFNTTISKMEKEEGVRIKKREISSAPTGNISRSHQLIKGLIKIHHYLGIESKFGFGNTGGSIPLSQGIPAVTIGITLGYGLHLPEEKIEIKPIIKGIKQLLLLILNIDRIK
ncbi:M20/M25/M40 family metallo-hydrolase [candidate division WOR-3 bacterium]|nr:M20/M25/M40 family metallo-hydrolase [candidate division WOR-3 bacterium]